MHGSTSEELGNDEPTSESAGVKRSERIKRTPVHAVVLRHRISGHHSGARC